MSGGRAPVGPGTGHNAGYGYGDGGIDPENADTYAMGAQPSIAKFAKKGEMDTGGIDIDLEETEVPGLKRKLMIMYALAVSMFFLLVVLAYLVYDESQKEAIVKEAPPAPPPPPISFAGGADAVVTDLISATNGSTDTQQQFVEALEAAGIVAVDCAYTVAPCDAECDRKITVTELPSSSLGGGEIGAPCPCDPGSDMTCTPDPANLPPYVAPAADGSEATTEFFQCAVGTGGCQNPWLADPGMMTLAGKVDPLAESFPADCFVYIDADDDNVRDDDETSAAVSPETGEYELSLTSRATGFEKIRLTPGPTAEAAGDCLDGKQLR